MKTARDATKKTDLGSSIQMQTNEPTHTLKRSS